MSKFELDIDITGRLTSASVTWKCPNLSWTLKTWVTWHIQVTFSMSKLDLDIGIDIPFCQSGVVAVISNFWLSSIIFILPLTALLSRLHLGI